MFTGIIQGLGRLIGISPAAGERVLTVRPDFDWGEPLVLGESIAVSGTCLTVTGISGSEFTAHVSQETLSRSALARAGRGERVNLEKALRLSDRLGGHLVAGHVDGIGRILEIRPRDQSVILSFGMDKSLARYVIEKGSIAVDGISLTINSLTETGFTVNIIPHTLSNTTLALKRVGDYVNLETDMIGKYVARLMGRDGEDGGIDRNFLAEHGFL